ncbi:hypothetical protein [uncultured Flavonifractor sp.]|uniref:hypothetical protein n=1 Tax=uncultured Flavonifractor sp. TaxID=1193534 RepID=UPI0026107758|nr:hypothetical protein [uncultured Flavonifractor sp.]
MKRASILVLLLALLSAAALTGTSIAVQWKGSSVTVEAEALAGDPAAAEGLELSLPVYCQNAMLWELTVPAAQPRDTDSRFGFSSFGLRNAQFNLLNLASPYPVVRSVAGTPDTLKIEIPLGSSSYWEEAVQLVSDETPAGEERTRQIHLAEVYDAWPMRVYLEGNGIWNQPVGQTFADYFSIPIPQDYQVKITVIKNERGKETGIYIENDPQCSLECTVDTVEIDDAILFLLKVRYFSWESYQEFSADGSAIPGGWGIYRLTTNEDKTEGSLETLFSLPEGSMAQQFWASEDGSTLFLLTVEEGVLRLRIFDRNMALLDTQDLMPAGEEAPFYDLLQGEDFFMAVVADKDRFRFTVVEGQDGAWTAAFSAHTLTQEQSGYSFYSKDGYGANLLGVDYAQDRLAVCATNHDLEPGFYLSVYDQEGLAYLGLYTTSLHPKALVPLRTDLGMEFGETPFDTLSPSIRWQGGTEKGGTS